MSKSTVNGSHTFASATATLLRRWGRRTYCVGLLVGKQELVFSEFTSSKEVQDPKYLNGHGEGRNRLVITSKHASSTASENSSSMYK